MAMKQSCYWGCWRALWTPTGGLKHIRQWYNHVGYLFSYNWHIWKSLIFQCKRSDNDILCETWSSILKVPVYYQMEPSITSDMSMHVKWIWVFCRRNPRDNTNEWVGTYNSSIFILMYLTAIHAENYKNKEWNPIHSIQSNHISAWKWSQN